MRTGKRWWYLILLALLLLVAGVVVAEVTDTLPRTLVSSGGGAVMGSGMQMETAVGQPVVGAVSGDAGTLCGGFWCGPGAPEVVEPDFALYLPIAIRN